ncbi:hypothetical protein NBRC10513v2_000516 [Rhodotorula toruloides]|uniref:alpha-1,2-Mannosidase n=1 Tax=Rhodotorula toruloides TaxID=5286 RepID=A0A2T0A3K6_RHOTO|nr:Glycoside hydrolase [Rhodotorula toruloides]
MGPADDDGQAGPGHSRPIRPFSSSFPAHHPSYQPLPRTDSPSQRTAYSERQKQPYDDDRDPEGEVGYAVDGPEQFGASSSGGMGWAASFAGLRRGRAGRGRVLLGLAGLTLVYLVHEAWAHPSQRPWHAPQPLSASSSTPSPAHAGGNDPHRGIFYGEAPATASPTSHSRTSTTSTASVPRPTLDEAQLPIVDLSQFIKPPRPIPPSYPDPWEHVTDKRFKGREWLSPERFGGEDEGWKEVAPPPERTNPPARYLLKAFEYAAKVAGRAPDGRKWTLGRGVGFDERTGRPKIVDRGLLKLGNEAGWVPPKRFAATELGTGKVGEKKMRRVQADEVVDESGASEEERVLEEKRRREWVKMAFMHAWEGYSKHAWGHDELAPVSNLWSNNYNGWGATIVDSLDTLLMMNMSHEYNLAREHVSQIDFTYLVPSGSRTFSTDLPDLDDMDVPDPDKADGSEQPQAQGWVDSRLGKEKDQHSPTTIPWFETTIRYLGGLLSAFELSGDPLMLDRATELGNWLLPAFATEFGLPLARYAIGANPDGQRTGRLTLAEVGSMTLEMTRLSQLTGDETYYRAAQRAMDTLDTHMSPAQPRPTDPKAAAGPLWRGRLGTLLPSQFDPAYPSSLQGEYTFGGLTDSYYEYLIKQTQLTSFSLDQYPRMYREAIDSAYEYLVRPVEVVPGKDDMAIIGSMSYGSWKPEMQHLTCFAGGMLGLGAKLLDRPYDLEAGVNVTNVCTWVYESSETGVGGESTLFYERDEPSRFVVIDRPDGAGKVRSPRGSPVGVRSQNKRQIGRPETIESVFYMWRITGDRKWQDEGWKMFVHWVQHAITESGFGTIRNTQMIPAARDDSMESFVLGETLKYYYLLFSPRDFMSLDDYVFSTEAHPFWIAHPSAPRPPEPLWTGPDRNTPASFTTQMGEGTWVQKWARVQQAAALAPETRWKTAGVAAAAGGGGGVRPAAAVGHPGDKPAKRPTDEENAAAVRQGRLEMAEAVRKMEEAKKGGSV